MNNEPTLVNKVAESGIITLNLEQFLPDRASIVSFDLKPFLFKELLLREKDFRASITAQDWSQYAGKHVAVYCSSDAIIPMWAYMLVGAALEPFAQTVFSGTVAALQTQLLLSNLENMAIAEYTDKRVVIKGCGDIALPEAAFLSIATKLKPVVKSLMYGEPCSTVPVYKKK